MCLKLVLYSKLRSSPQLVDLVLSVANTFRGQHDDIVADNSEIYEIREISRTAGFASFAIFFCCAPWLFQARLDNSQQSRYACTKMIGSRTIVCMYYLYTWGPMALTDLILEAKPNKIFEGHCPRSTMTHEI
jgi:hypothetical protein